ncbi:uncharacterized protein EV154DRAFT_547240 [Mucor mucedo]|uniref:uncharacterized protein n=1 Tax=Mucor mucedo TaxID=29922 RepID=UPI00221F55EC|nr:uncharacterized protein EV154DRAFT_547240 [Mucor mucedo]KAI7896587.1 hypothetical protein EV154DRAFT_547240 [Mucor mucedo]
MLVDEEMLGGVGVESLENDKNYKNTDAMKKYLTKTVKCRRKANHCQKSTMSWIFLMGSWFGDWEDDILNYDFAEFPYKIWSHLIHRSIDNDNKHLANIIAYTLTDFHCNCKQPIVFNSNHERTPFVEYVIPMFKYLSIETG